MFSKARKYFDRTLSVLFPYEGELGKLNQGELNRTLAYRERDSRHNRGMVYSSAGDVREGRTKRKLSPRERRAQGIKIDREGMRVGDVLIETLR